MVYTVPFDIAHLVIESVQTTPLPSLPLERKTLASCSLVCRSWKSSAQSRLFQSVKLKTSRPLDHFLTFLTSSSHLAAAIRLLIIYSHVPPECLKASADPRDADPRSGYSPLSPVLLAQIAAVLPSSAELQLQMVTLLGWPRDAPLPTTPVKLRKLGAFGVAYLPLARSRSGLRTLVRALTRQPTRPVDQPHDLFSFFELDQLVVAHNSTDESVADPSTLFTNAVVLSTATRPVVRSFDLTGIDCLAVTSLITGGFDPDHFETLRLTPDDSDSIAFAGMFVRCHSACVRNIELCVSHAIDHDRSADVELWATCGIFTCTRLETLRLSWKQSTLREPGDTQDVEACDAFDAILSLTPRTLRRLTFALPTMHTREKLASALSHLVPRVERVVPGFPRLEKVTLVVTRAYEAEDLGNIMRDSMPSRRLVDNGILEIENKVASKYFNIFEEDNGFS